MHHRWQSLIRVHAGRLMMWWYGDILVKTWHDAPADFGIIVDGEREEVQGGGVQVGETGVLGSQLAARRDAD